MSPTNSTPSRALSSATAISIVHRHSTISTVPCCSAIDEVLTPSLPHYCQPPSSLQYQSFCITVGDVCKAWAKIISNSSFIKAHLLQSKGGLFIQKFGMPYNSGYLELNEGDFKMKHLDCSGQMVSSCGGVSLFCSSHPKRFLCVGNHVTMQYKSLPFAIVEEELFPSCHIAFISCTGEYEVLCHCVNLSGEHRWLVLSVGNNMSWRKLETSLKGNDLDPGIVT
ncbi:uncharacterized protein LOC114323169 isoform X4 [Camellia sinensis]|nr:uncharacterized protein LOC114323169 isoform X4 [Camellia sinensis]